MPIRSRSPFEWLWVQIKGTVFAVGSVADNESAAALGVRQQVPAVRRIGVGDLREALALGFADFTHFRGDVVFLCAVYPVAGLVLGQLAFGYNVLPLIFPLVAGFALFVPLAEVGLNE